MLFCDLCDRGYHSYCVGLDEIPSGRWHCVEVKYYLLKIFNDFHFGNWFFKIFCLIFFSKNFSALNVDCVEKIILWAGKKSPMNLCGLCVERKLTGFSNTNLETLEEKSILILCVYPVTGRLIPKQV